MQVFTKCINQVSNVIKKKHICVSIEAMAYICLLEDLLPVMKQVYDISFRKEVKGEKVPCSEKIFSIFERHTDIIYSNQIGTRKIGFNNLEIIS